MHEVFLDRIKNTINLIISETCTSLTRRSLSSKTSSSDILLQSLSNYSLVKENAFTFIQIRRIEAAKDTFRTLSKIFRNRWEKKILEARETWFAKAKLKIPWTQHEQRSSINKGQGDTYTKQR